MKISTNQPVIFRVNDHTIAFDAGAPLELSQKDYEVLSKDSLYQKYLKEGIISEQQSKPPDEPPATPPEDAPKPSGLKPKS